MTGLDKNTEVDTIKIPKRNKTGNESHSDLIFGGAIGGILLLLGVGAIIAKCIVGNKSGNEIHYEME